MTIQSNLYNTGMELLKELHGGHAGEQIINQLQDICPDYATMTIEWAFGSILSRSGLDIKTRELAIIASCGDKYLSNKLGSIYSVLTSSM